MRAMVHEGRNAATVFAGRALGTLASILFVTVVPRALGPAEYGYFSYWFSQVFLFFTIFDLGGIDLIRRYLPGFMAAGSGQSRTLVHRVFRLKFILLPILYVALLPFYGNVPAYTAIFLGSVAAAFSYVLSETHFAANRMVHYSLYQLLRKLLRFSLVLVLFRLMGRAGIIPTLVVTEVAVLAIFSAWNRGLFPEEGPRPLDRSLLYYLHFGVLVYLSTLLFLAMGRLPVIVAKARGLTFVEIGYLALVVDICYFTLRELFYGISESYLPSQAVEMSNGRSDNLGHSFNKVLVNTMALMLPCLVLLGLQAPGVIALIGDKYLPALPLFVAFLPVAALNVVTFVYRQVLILYEHKGWILSANVCSFATFLGFALLPQTVTIMTLTVAVLASSVVNCLLTSLLAHRALTIPGELKAWGGLIAATSAFALILSPGRGSPWPIQLLLLILSSCSYVLLLWKFNLLALETPSWLRRKGAR